MKLTSLLFLVFLICSCASSEDGKEVAFEQPADSRAPALVIEDTAQEPAGFTALLPVVMPETTGLKVPPVKKQADFRLISAEYENWVAGIQEGGRGTEYTFRIFVTTPKKLTFDSAWILQHAFSAYVAKETKEISSAPVTFGQGDTILVRVSEVYKESRDENPIQLPPMKFRGDALLGYHIDGKRNYFIIKNINKGITINRP